MIINQRPFHVWLLCQAMCDSTCTDCKIEKLPEAGMCGTLPSVPVTAEYDRCYPSAADDNSFFLRTQGYGYGVRTLWRCPRFIK